MGRCAKKIVAVAFAVLFGVCVGETLSPREFLKLEPEEVAKGGEASVRGVVTFVSGIERRFVIAPQDNPRHAGVMVLCGDGVSSPENGDLVLVSGQTIRYGGLPAVKATRVDVIRSTTLPIASGVKQADFRRGLLFNRRISLTGKAVGMRGESAAGANITVMSLELDNYVACVKIPGVVDADGVVGETVRVTGLAVNRNAEDGLFLDAELEVSGVDALDVIEKNAAAPFIIAAMCVLGAVVMFFAGMSFFLWRRGVRVKRDMEVVAAERRRMAADLHDTIEQHLAGANLIAAGVQSLDGVTPEVVEAMKALAGLLANAKAEVRSSVMNLRNAGDVSVPLSDAIGSMVTSLKKTGVRARKCLRGLPDTLPEVVAHDLVQIIREATTNAVKHGKAGRVVFTSDPLPGGGFEFKVLNDGAPFEIDSALGPETGHYGLSGMRERALRSRLGIEWGRDGRWTFVRIVAEKGVL
jgi:signal transduction histidine kinase